MYSNPSSETAENEEALLTNTFLNSKQQPVAEFQDNPNKLHQTKLQWIDNQTEGKSAKLMTVMIPPYEKVDFKKKNANSKIQPKKICKSIIKQSESKNDSSQQTQSQSQMDEKSVENGAAQENKNLQKDSSEEKQAKTMVFFSLQGPDKTQQAAEQQGVLKNEWDCKTNLKKQRRNINQ